MTLLGRGLRPSEIHLRPGQNSWPIKGEQTAYTFINICIVYNEWFKEILIYKGLVDIHIKTLYNLKNYGQGRVCDTPVGISTCNMGNMYKVSSARSYKTKQSQISFVCHYKCPLFIWCWPFRRYLYTDSYHWNILN